MRVVVTGQEMKLLDKNTSDYFMVPSGVLMEQAAMAFVRELFLLKKDYKKILVVCGTGNNAGDGIAIARLLNQAGIFCKIYFINNPPEDNSLYALQWSIYKQYGFPIATSLNDIEDYDCIIDGIFGIGLSREITGSFKEVIEKINSVHATKIAIDIPSGVSADDGSILGCAVACDYTFTFSFAKRGLYLWPGADMAGKISVLPIGITKDSFLKEKPTMYALEACDLSLLPKRYVNSNKGSYGKLLVVAGSKDMAGAAYFSAKAALKMGTGMVQIFTHSANRNLLLSLLPEAIVTTYENTPTKEKLDALVHWADAIVVGPGLGMDQVAHQLLEMFLSYQDIPILVDADGINLMAMHRNLLEIAPKNMIFTPHLGEMSRLTGQTVSYVKENLCQIAKAFASNYGQICILKDFHTITALSSGQLYINLSGCNGMATAGSGDVLTGIIGALLAQGVSPEESAYLGVFVHGLAGMEESKNTSNTSLIASDIIEGIVHIFKNLE